MPSPSKAVDARYKDNLKRRYGMEVEEYVSMCNEQQGACAICREFTPRLCVDHNHETGKVRGLLCHRCNVALGHFNDDVQRIADAISYLSKFSGSQGDGDILSSS